MARFGIFPLFFCSICLALFAEKHHWYNIYSVSDTHKLRKVGYLHMKISQAQKRGIELQRQMLANFRLTPNGDEYFRNAYNVSYADSQFRLKYRRATFYSGSNKKTMRVSVKKNVVIFQMNDQSNKFHKEVPYQNAVYWRFDGFLLKKIGKLFVGARGEVQLVTEEIQDINAVLFSVERREKLSLAIGDFNAYVVEFRQRAFSATGTMHCSEEGHLLQLRIQNVVFAKTSREDAHKLPASITSRTLRTSDGSAQITLYGGMKKIHLNHLAILEAANIRQARFVQITRLPREDGSLQRFHRLIQHDISRRISSSKHSAATKIKLHTYEAVQSRIEGLAQEEQISFLLTVVDTENFIYSIVAWTPTAVFSTNHPILDKVIRSFRELR